jgi:hypothetical protein
MFAGAYAVRVGDHEWGRSHSALPLRAVVMMIVMMIVMVTVVVVVVTKGCVRCGTLTMIAQTRVDAMQSSETVLTVLANLDIFLSQYQLYSFTLLQNIHIRRISSVHNIVGRAPLILILVFVIYQI